MVGLARGDRGTLLLHPPSNYVIEGQRGSGQQQVLLAWRQNAVRQGAKAARKALSAGEEGAIGVMRRR
jgi:hypothetical protein